LSKFSTCVAHLGAAKVVVAPPFLYATLTHPGVPCPSITKAPQCGAVNVMDKSNIAFALPSVILGIYISVALLLSRVQKSRTNKTGHRQSDHHGLPGHQ